MEFPDIGNNCSYESCNQLDFLPFNCGSCQKTFCKEHSKPQKHNCKCYRGSPPAEKKASPYYTCSAKDCKKVDALEMNCAICKKHFCLAHRHHECLDIPPSQLKREKWQAPKDQFKQAKAATDRAIEDKLKTSSNRALANKIKLMKLKRVAVGDNHIPSSDRIFFAVAPPLEGKEQSDAKALFTSKNWTVGRTIDLLARRLKAINRNNEPDGPKLRLFNSDGEIISQKMDVEIDSLIKDGTLFDGDSVILEYLTQNDIESGKTSCLSETININKYKWI